MSTPVQVNQEFISKVQEYAQKAGSDIAGEVQKVIDFVHMGLGNPGAVTAAETTWGVTGVHAIASSTQDIKTAVNNLSAYWEGPASTAFTGYAADITTNAMTMQTAFTAVQAALASASMTVTEVYNTVLGLIGTAAQAIVDFEADTLNAASEDVIELTGHVAGAILSALSKLIGAFTTAVQEALTEVAQYKQAAIAAMSAIAAIGSTAVEPLPAASADASEYSVVHKPGN
jgi:uncharacterized protein YukE